MVITFLGRLLFWVSTTFPLFSLRSITLPTYQDSPFSRLVNGVLETYCQETVRTPKTNKQNKKVYKKGSDTEQKSRRTVTERVSSKINITSDRIVNKEDT